MSTLVSAVMVMALLVHPSAQPVDAVVNVASNVTLAWMGDIADRWLPFENTTGADCSPALQALSPWCGGGAARAKTVIDALDAMFPGEVIVTTVGGFAFGAEFARIGNGKFAAQYMSDMGVDVTGTASAEWFDGGTIGALRSSAAFAIANSDLYFASNLTAAWYYGLNFTSSVTLDTNGERVGFLALTDSSIIPITSLYALLGTRGFHSDHYVAARRAVLLLEQSGVNKIVLLLQYNIDSFSLIAQVPGIDAVIVTSDINPSAAIIEYGVSAAGIPVPVLTCTSQLTAVCWVQLQFDEFGFLIPSDELKRMTLAALGGGPVGYTAGSVVRFDATGRGVVRNATVYLTNRVVPDAALNTRVNNDYTTCK